MVGLEQFIAEHQLVDNRFQIAFLAYSASFGELPVDRYLLEITLVVDVKQLVPDRLRLSVQVRASRPALRGCGEQPGQ
jgi:hypothetical protein